MFDSAGFPSVEVAGDDDVQVAGGEDMFGGPVLGMLNWQTVRNQHFEV